LLNPLHTAWRARRVLLIAKDDRLSAFLTAFLEELGAKPARLAPGANAQTLCRAMTAGRIGAVIVPAMRDLSPGEDLFTSLSALHLLLGEMREAGVPLALFGSDAGVYRIHHQPWQTREDDPIGGETQDGLIQSILQLYADGVSRGLAGDAVSAVIVRHLPLLGCGHPAVQQALSWCHALAAGECIPVAHPGAAGVFMHPLDMLCAMLALGARHFLMDTPCAGVYNLSAGAHNVLANRTAALRLIRDHGGTRPIRESEPPLSPSLPMLDDSRIRRLCGVRSLIPGQEALSMLYALEQAAQSPEAYAHEIRRQTQNYLSRIP